MPKMAVALLALLLLTTIGTSQGKSGLWLRGAWEGTGYQTDTDSTWTMRLKAQGDKYSIEYPSLGCGGEWRLISIDATEARFREIITYGQEECANNGLVVIRRLNNRQVIFLYSNLNTEEVTASAILKKKD